MPLEVPTCWDRLWDRKDTSLFPGKGPDVAGHWRGVFLLDKTNVYLKKVCEPLIDGARRRRRMSVPYVARLAALGRWRVERAPDAETAEMRRTASRAPHLLTGRLSMTFGRPPQLADPAINEMAGHS